MSACVSVLECLSVAVLTAQSVSQCVCRGEARVQLEWVLLDAQFALLQRLIQQGERQARPGTERQSLVAKRCQALTALIRLCSVAPCQELTDMQERVRGNRENALFFLVFVGFWGLSVIQRERLKRTAL